MSKITRREFLAAAGAAAILGPRVFAAASDVKPARIAFIGVGGRGTGLLRVMLKLKDVTVLAICDINEKHLNRALFMWENADPQYRPAREARATAQKWQSDVQ